MGELTSGGHLYTHQSHQQFLPAKFDTRKSHNCSWKFAIILVKNAKFHTQTSTINVQEVGCHKYWPSYIGKHNILHVPCLTRFSVLLLQHGAKVYIQRRLRGFTCKSSSMTSSMVMMPITSPPSKSSISSDCCAVRGLI